jgi:hypothetical protein
MPIWSVMCYQVPKVSGNGTGGFDFLELAAEGFAHSDDALGDGLELALPGVKVLFVTQNPFSDSSTM